MVTILHVKWRRMSIYESTNDDSKGIVKQYLSFRHVTHSEILCSFFLILFIVFLFYSFFSYSFLSLFFFFSGASYN